MDFFFYVPNLLLVEAWLRARDAQAGPALRYAAAGAMVAATAFVALATAFFTMDYWGPPIVARLPLPM